MPYDILGSTIDIVEDWTMANKGSQLVREKGLIYGNSHLVVACTGQIVHISLHYLPQHLLDLLDPYKSPFVVLNVLYSMG